MREKAALRDVAASLLPAGIAARQKQPYRAPEIAPFFGPDAPGWVAEALSRSELAATGLWDGDRVASLVRRCEAGRATGMRESMALVGILSTQLWHRGLVGRGATAYPPETGKPHVRIDRTNQTRTEEAA
jgi:asparagine synthase (glutamine-hydrolysing)